MGKAIIGKPLEKATGLASVLAIGTANPSNVVEQSSFPEFYFNITNSNHMVDAKAKFERMCAKSGIKERHLYLSETVLQANPNLCDYGSNSLDTRQDILVVEIPKLGKEAALKAIQEWGQPLSKITHLVFCTTTGLDMPGADYALIRLLGLRSTVKRVMLYQQGCFAGGTVLRIAKDLAENTKGSRILVVCSEITVFTFRAPNEAHLDNMVGQALFGDGASALIVGADPIEGVEKPCFEVHTTGTSLVPGSDGALKGHIRELGLLLHFKKEVPEHIGMNISSVVREAFDEAFGESAPEDYNDLFWIVHPGGPAILDGVEEALKLKPGRMQESREVLSHYGNMFSPCVFFIMDGMRKKSMQHKCSTSGEGLPWGVLLGFGPGLTVETVVLKSVPLP